MDSLRLILLVLNVIVGFRTGATMDEDQTNNVTYRVPASIKVTTFNDMPYSGVYFEDGKWMGRGYAFYMLDLMSKKLNFTYTIVPPAEHILGSKDSGLLGMLYQKKVDMAVAFLPVLPQMNPFCKFSTPLDESTLTAIMERPSASATGSGLLAPFNTTVWILVVSSIFIVAPTIYLFALVRAKLWSDDTENFTMAACFWFVYSSLLKQGTNVIATTDSTRMLFATWWIFILILSSFYTANLTAFLTTPQFTLPINSLKDIVDRGYKWVTFSGRTIEFLLTQPSANELTMLNRTARYRGEYVKAYDNPADTIFESIKKKKLYLGEAHYLQTFLFDVYMNRSRAGMEHGKRCSYVIMPGGIILTNRAFAFPPNSTIDKPINQELLYMVEAGIVNFLKKSDLPLAEACPVDLRSIDRQLRNADLQLTYKIVGAGYAIAAVVFLIEFLCRLFSNTIKQRNERQTMMACCNRKRENPQSSDTPQYQMNSMVNYRHSERPNLLKRTPPPIYQDTIVGEDILSSKRHCINGRDYYVIMERSGHQRLIPIRAPSAFLFQYAA